MRDSKDLFDYLGVSKVAAASEIAIAYNKALLRYTPVKLQQNILDSELRELSDDIDRVMDFNHQIYNYIKSEYKKYIMASVVKPYQEGILSKVSQIIIQSFDSQNIDYDISGDVITCHIGDYNPASTNYIAIHKARQLFDALSFVKITLQLPMEVDLLTVSSNIVRVSYQFSKLDIKTIDADKLQQSVKEIEIANVFVNFYQDFSKARQLKYFEPRLMINPETRRTEIFFYRKRQLIENDQKDDKSLCAAVHHLRSLFSSSFTYNDQELGERVPTISIEAAEKAVNDRDGFLRDHGLSFQLEDVDRAKKANEGRDAGRKRSSSLGANQYLSGREGYNTARERSNSLGANQGERAYGLRFDNLCIVRLIHTREEMKEFLQNVATR